MNTKEEDIRHIITVLLGEIEMLSGDGMADDALAYSLLAVSVIVAKRGFVGKAAMIDRLQITAHQVMRDVP